MPADQGTLNPVTALAKATAAAPSYTEGTPNALSQDLSGNVRTIGTATISAGSAIIGKVGIDQTTPGTTDSVTVSTAQGAGAAIGATNGAAVITDVNGTIQQYLRGLVKLLITAGGAFVSHAAAATGGYSFLNIVAGQATTTVKSGAGTLHSITFNSPGTATNTTTVYDNTAASGTVIAIVSAAGATVPTTLIYDIAFATGLTIITATANGSNMTVAYK